jgi:hypothetical protein
VSSKRSGIKPIWRGVAAEAKAEEGQRTIRGKKEKKRWQISPNIDIATIRRWPDAQIRRRDRQSKKICSNHFESKCEVEVIDLLKKNQSWQGTTRLLLYPHWYGLCLCRCSKL